MTEETERAEHEWVSRRTRWQEHWQEAVLRPGLADRPRFEVAATKIIRRYHDDWREIFIWVDSPLVLGVAAPVASFIITLAGKHGMDERRAAFDALSDACLGLRSLVLADHFELSSPHKDMISRFGGHGVAFQDLFLEIQSAISGELHPETQEEWAQLALKTSTEASRTQAIVSAIRAAVVAATHCTRHDADKLIHRIMLRWPLDLLIHYGLNELGQGLFHLNERTDGAALNFYRNVLGLRLKAPWDDLEQLWTATLESAFWWWPHQDFVMVCERPAYLKQKTEEPTGKPSLVVFWLDGWNVCIPPGSTVFRQ